jgi:hypothetical protein
MHRNIGSWMKKIIEWKVSLFPFYSLFFDFLAYVEDEKLILFSGRKKMKSF